MSIVADKIKGVLENLNIPLSAAQIRACVNELLRSRRKRGTFYGLGDSGYKRACWTPKNGCKHAELLERGLCGMNDRQNCKSILRCGCRSNCGNYRRKNCDLRYCSSAKN